MPAMAWSRLVLPLPLGPTRQVSVPLPASSALSCRRCGKAESCRRRARLIGPILQRIWTTSQRKKGAPSKAVTTPIGRVRPSGRGPHDQVRREQQQRRRWPRRAGSRGPDVRPSVGARRSARRDRRSRSRRRSRRRRRRRARSGRRSRPASGATSWPSDSATSSPSVRLSSAARIRQSKAMVASAGTPAKAAWARLRSTSEPISQS